MAQRRMFSPKIVSSDAFLDMPSSSQSLYFHLGMYADDDGFVNPRFVMRLAGASEDDIKLLLTKRFLLPFENGVIVIKHWKINNLIKKDRYTPTVYQEEVKLLTTKENGAYTERFQNGSKMVPQYSIGKVSIGKVILATPKSVAGKEIAEIIYLFKEVNPSIEKMYANKSQRASVERMLKKHGREKLEEIIKVLPQVNARPYWPKSTTPIQLEDNLGKYKALNDSDKAKVEGNKLKIHIIS